MRVGVSLNGKTIDKNASADTPADFEDGLKMVEKIGRELTRELEKRGGKNSAEPKLIGIAGGIAGPLSKDKKSLAKSPNLPDWVAKPLSFKLQKIFGAPVFLENDAVLAGLGEATAGAGRGASIVAYITVSTGVGGARIVDGKIDEKTIGFEPGHQIIDADKTIIPDARGKMFEDYISGTAVLHETGKKPKEVKDPEYWNEMARLLAYGLNNTIVHWSPDVVVLGGSMITGDPAIPIPETERHLRSILKIYGEIPKLKMAQLGESGGLYGALEYLKQNS